MRTALVTQTAKSYAAVTGELRAAAVNTALKDSPRCAVTRFLAGCEAFDAESPAIAVRHMMVAHHSQPQLQAAALLVFAGLSRVQHTDQPLLSTLLETWEEFRRPAFDQTPAEQALLDCFTEPEPMWDNVSSLARRLWRLPIRTLREQIRDVAADPEHAPALLFPVAI
jgi:hypothetical protein